MKRIALLLFLAGWLVPLASAQDRFQVGAYADYFRISQTILCRCQRHEPACEKQQKCNTLHSCSPWTENLEMQKTGAGFGLGVSFCLVDLDEPSRCRVARASSAASSGPGQRQKKRQITFQFLCDKEIFLHMVMAVLAQLRRDFRVREQESNLVRRAFYGMREQAGVLVNDLNRNAAHRRSHHRFFLPQRLGNSKAEAFAQAFLNDNRRSRLQRIDFQRRPSRKLENLDVRVVVRFAQDFFQDHGAFGIVRCTAAREDELAVEVSLDDAVGADYTDGILQAVEARDLREDRTLGIDPVACENLSDEVPLKFLVFLGKRIDGRIKKILRNRKLAGKFRRGKHSPVIAGNEFFEEIPDRAVRM